MRHREYRNVYSYCNGIAYGRVDIAFGNISTSYPTAYDTVAGKVDSGSIDDLKGPKNAVKPCVHTRVITSPDGPTELSWGSGDSTVTFTSQGFGKSLLWRIMSAKEDPTSISSRTTESDFHNPDWFALIHEFNEHVDKISPREFFLGEMLYEYEIFVDALKFLINPTSGIKTLLKLGRKLGRQARLGQVASISRSAASGYLGYTFGVKPAVHDVRSTLDAHRKIARRIAFLKEHAGQWIPVKVRIKIPSSVTDLGWPSDPTFMSLRKKCIEKYTMASISANVQVKRNFSQRDVWRAYSEYFGLGDVLQLAWELVPFSFVIDWFTNFQERIDASLRPLRAGSPFCAIKDLCFTQKQVLHERSFTSPNGFYSALGKYSTLSEWTPTCDYFTSSYHRMLRVPNTSGVVDLSTLGLFHAITGGALVLQRRG